MFDIESYPSLKVLRGRYAYDYDGNATVEGLIDFIQNENYLNFNPTINMPLEFGR